MVAAAAKPETPAALRCRALVKKYDDVTAVDGLDLEVRAGECFGLLGPNGAGKTTTVEILEGLLPPDGGEVEVLGQRWGTRGDHALRERLGVQLQETQLGEKLTVEETVALFRSFYTRGRGVDEVVRLVELDEKRRARVGKLSGGQRQRLALACALVSDPELLFLDEPTTGLDPQARLKIWEIVEAFRARGGTALLTTHYMEEAARLCDRVAIMDHGKVIALGTPADLVRSLGADQIIEFTASAQPAGAAPGSPGSGVAPVQIDDAALARLPGVRRVARKAAGYVLTVAHIGEALAALLAELERQHVTADAITTRQATLEDVFVHHTGRALRDD